MTLVTSAEFKFRRQKLFQHLGNRTAIVKGAKEQLRNGDVYYPFRQDSNFYYLTGFNEPDAIAVFKDGEFILFNRPRNPEREIWEGAREGQEGVIKNYGADKAYPITEFKEDKNTVDVTSFLAEQRLIKSADEIKTMRKANEISINAHIKTIQECKQATHEYELQSVFTGECIKRGSFAMAYPAIVGAGKNSCVLHYSANNQKINNSDIILIDAGCEFENYASDITRCYPSNGKFNPQQKAVYELVYEAQRAAIESIKPGLAWNAPQEIIVNILTQGLKDLKLYKDSYKQYYMHNFGHWIGLDVHDVGNRDTLQAGNVITIEPGLYIPEWNIGIRIEDDIVVTETGHENLTEKLPRKLSDIEALLNS